MTPRLVCVLLPCDQDLLELAQVRCPQLKNLNLFHGILNSFPKFGKLEVLIIRQDLATSEERENGFLHVIGTHCTNLRKLDISLCSGVTDHSIEGLCLGLNNLSSKSGNLGRCKSLQVLKLGNRMGHKITKKGIKIALENLPALRILDHNTTVEVLADIAKTNLNQMLPKFALSAISITFVTPYRSGSLGLAISLCPSVTSVLIHEVAGITNRDLLSLMTFQKLQQLQIHGHPNLGRNQEKITFNDGVIPLLKVIGSSLKELELLWLSDVNVHIIAEFCPNLSRLCLDDILSYTIPCPDEANTNLMSKRSHTNFQLKSLTFLHLVVREGKKSANHPPRETLLLLLSSPLLSLIQICRSDTLTDDVLLAATKVHHFENVKNIIFIHCNFVSKRGIDVFMEHNSLKAISLYHCKKVTKENIHSWENQAQKKNWDLCIDSEGCL